MLISAKVIRKPRKVRRCETCRKEIAGPQVRCYGCGMEGDPLYVIHLHPECAMEDTRKKAGLEPMPDEDEMTVDDFYDWVNDDEGDELEFDCKMRPDGSCGAAMSEDCEFECPNRHERRRLEKMK